MTRRAALLAVGLGVVAGTAARHGAGPTLGTARFRRRNARGRDVATAGGVAPLATLAAAAFLAPRADGVRRAALAAVPLGLAGLVDDLAGERSGTGGPRGFAGHLGALARGRPTTGVLKVVAGGAAGLAAAPPGPFAQRLVDAGVVALAANLGNLLDRAPGRTTKVAVLAAAGLLAADRLPAGPAFAVGATAATLPADLGEVLMLGDTGANLVGAALGAAIVERGSPRARQVVLGGLVALTLASERWSFSAAIAATPALRRVDQLGRHRPAG